MNRAVVTLLLLALIEMHGVSVAQVYSVPRSNRVITVKVILSAGELEVAVVDGMLLRVTCPKENQDLAFAFSVAYQAEDSSSRPLVAVQRGVVVRDGSGNEEIRFSSDLLYLVLGGEQVESPDGPSFKVTSIASEGHEVVDKWQGVNPEKGPFLPSCCGSCSNCVVCGCAVKGCVLSCAPEGLCSISAGD